VNNALRAAVALGTLASGAFESRPEPSAQEIAPARIGKS
jgi:hypothetical protein